MTKSELRKKIRSTLPTAVVEIAEKSAAICAFITRDEIWQRANVVGLFAPQPHEPNVELLWMERAGKTFCYPRVRPDGLDFLTTDDPAKLEVGRWNLREPAFEESHLISVSDIDLLLVPGVAFTPIGDRMGRGGGFYDRLLSSLSPKTIPVGVCFDCQIVEALTMEPHDRSVQRVVTEAGWKGALRRGRLKAEG